MVCRSCAAVILLLLAALAVAGYPATEGELIGIIQNCEESVCHSAVADCGAACVSEKDECFSDCRGTMSACFNECEIVQQSCLGECATARTACVNGCLTQDGLGACVPLYNSTSTDQFIICVMSHEPGPAIPTPAASSTPVASPAATATSYPTPFPQCGAGMIWNGTGCVPPEIPQSAPCLIGFALAAIIAFALFARHNRW
mgnify:CR=1 FL=1